jgi:hypothetical protein
MIWQWLYWLMVITGVAASAWRMRASIWWIAFFSSAMYGLPVAYGKDLFGQTLTVEANIALLLVIATTLLAALFLKQRRAQAIDPAWSSFFVIVASAVSVVSFVAIIATHGLSIFFVHKTESGIGGYYYILWRLSATFAFLSCLLTKRYKWAAIVSIPLVATLFAGDRTAVGMAAISCVWAIFHVGSLSRAKALPIALALIFVGAFLFFGKTFQAQWSTGTFPGIWAYVNELYQQGQDAVAKTEPFATAGVMNALIRFNRSPPDPLFLEVAAQFLLVPSLFGFESSSFNDFFQPILFPMFRERSLAYSYWGEAIVRGGWFDFVVFLTIYMAVLWAFDRATELKSFAIRLFAYVGGAYWAFYIHRNSMVSIIAYERQIGLFVVLIVVAAYLLRGFNRGMVR